MKHYTLEGLEEVSPEKLLKVYRQYLEQEFHESLYFYYFYL